MRSEVRRVPLIRQIMPCPTDVPDSPARPDTHGVMTGEIALASITPDAWPTSW
ncbi:hypothetical protein ACF053_25805 [Streptomyces kanasensis]|uniref:hypothetical protein n=1 Tax=Streptomyces kanasensis TaxID=936756 RepID=UPI00370052D2